MRCGHALFPLCIAFAFVGCASHERPASVLTGSRTAHLRIAPEHSDPATRPAVVPVEHVFRLTDSGDDPVVLAAQQTRIDTTWHFVDSDDAVLPRTVAPGESVGIAVTAKARDSDARRHFVRLTLASGEVVELELHVEG